MEFSEVNEVNDLICCAMSIKNDGGLSINKINKKKNKTDLQEIVEDIGKDKYLLVLGERN